MDHSGNTVDYEDKENSWRIPRPAQNKFSHKPINTGSRSSNRRINAAENWIGEIGGNSRNIH